MNQNKCERCDTTENLDSTGGGLYICTNCNNDYNIERLIEYVRQQMKTSEPANPDEIEGAIENLIQTYNL